jgi:hypothetical protein
MMIQGGESMKWVPTGECGTFTGHKNFLKEFMKMSF